MGIEVGSFPDVEEGFDVLGVRFDRVDSDGIVSRISASLHAHRGGWVVTPNVDILRQVAKNPDLAELVADAPLVVVDGAPVEWAAQIAGRGRVHRTAGASLVFPLTQAAASNGFPILLLGGRPGAGVAAAENLRQALPGLVVSEHCPPYGFEQDVGSVTAIAEAVRAVRGGIVLCGFGFPKQERLMRQLFEDFPDTWFLGVGGSIDFLGGFVRRAPHWVQAIGFEWLFRLLMEPRRLARRYLIDDMPFAVRLLAWAVGERLRGAPEERELLLENVVPAIRRIDLDARTVDLTSPGLPEPVRLSFDEFNSAETSSKASRPPTGSTQQIIDLRDPTSDRADEPTDQSSLF